MCLVSAQEEQAKVGLKEQIVKGKDRASSRKPKNRPTGVDLGVLAGWCEKE